MNKARSFRATIPFCIALVMPMVVPIASAAPMQYRDYDDRVHHRYYDREHRDYHRWNAAEERRYRRYWTSERGPYTAWERASDEQRRAYWHWRHEQAERRHRHY